MGSSSPASSVVVSTYDPKRWSDLAACVDSLLAQTRPPHEVIVVVDHNPDLLEHASAELHSATVIPNQRPRGLAGARNSGVDAASSDIIAFIDDDARAEPDWLARLEECFDEADTVGAGGALLPRWTAGEPEWFPREFYWVFGCSYTGLPDRLSPVRNPIGANMAVRRSVLHEVGGFRQGDEDEAPDEIRARGVVRAAGNVPDDTEFAIRVKQRLPDAIWLYQPEARVHHTVTPERTSLGYFVRRCFEEGVGKANLKRFVGADEGLSSERRQLLSVLPASIARGLREAVSGHPAAALRVLAIVLGVAVTAAGFASASARPLLARGESRE